MSYGSQLLAPRLLPFSSSGSSVPATPSGVQYALPLPSLTETQAALTDGSMRTADIGEWLSALGLDVSPSSALARLSERRAEALRILSGFPVYARAALWHLRLAGADDVAGASAVQSFLPPSEPGATVAASFARPDGRDLEEVGGALARYGTSGAPAATPFGQIIAMPPAPPTGQPPGVAAAATEAMLRQLVASQNSMVTNFGQVFTEQSDGYCKVLVRGGVI